MKFDLVVIGAGAAGLVSSGFAARLGVKVALVSDGPAGGECLWTGCVPSKALIASAQVAHTLKTSKLFGFPDTSYQCDFASVMQRMKRVRERISHHDSKEAVESAGTRLIEGRAEFISSNAIRVNGTEIEARKFIIATGGSQRIPPVKGLAEAGCLTHETILDLETKPEHLVIIGGGPVGVEYAQVMLRLGIKVTLVEMAECPLPKEEPETSALLCKLLKSEGAENIHLQNKAMEVTVSNGTKRVLLSGPTGPITVECDQILVATGKTANTDNLKLELAGVEADHGFVNVDRHQRTSAPNIWACGDVCKGYQFTHYADHQARVAVMNACLRLPIKREETVVPWCTFTDPEIASVGLRESEAVAKFGKDNVLALQYGLDDFDRAIIDDVPLGFIKVCVLKNGKILGASIVGERAGELIHEFALAMKRKIKIQDLAGLIHVYPTMSTAIGNVSASYFNSLANNGWQSKLLRFWVNCVK